MKQHITPEDLSSLSESQKMNLRDMWLPEVNTLAAASICKDVINDEYDTIIFVIGDIIVQEGRTNLFLRRLRLVDDVFIDEEENGQENEEENLGLPDGETEDEFEFEYSEPEQYFSKQDCLPLLSIGQMIELLSGLKFGQDGFSISIPSSRTIIGDKGYTVTNRVDLEYEEDSLCDALWNTLKDFI